MRGIDRRLHLLLGDVDVEAEGELQHDDRSAAGAGGGHLAETLELAELPFERGGDGGGHHVWVGPGVEREHLDGRIVDLWQGGDGQLRVGDDPHQQNGRHQQRGGDRPQDEWAGRTHGVLLSVVLDGIGVLEMLVFTPSCNFSKLLVATTVPGSMPSTAVIFSSETPVFTLLTLAVPFTIA